MRRLLIGLTLFAIAFSAIATPREVRKGYWVPVCDGVEISRHTRYGKALLAVVNHGSDCDIIPPVFEVRFKQGQKLEPEPEPELNDLKISWTTPARNEDGTEIKTIDRFNLYWGLTGSFQNVVQVEADSNSYTLAGLSAGSYSIYMSTVSNGDEGKPSAPITVDVIKRN